MAISFPADRMEEIYAISLQGEWDLSRGLELRRELEAAIAHPHVILDLSNVTYIDSNCLAMLASTRRKRIAKGYCPSCMVLGSSSVRRIFELAGFSDLWTICRTLDEAYERMKYRGNISVSDST